MTPERLRSAVVAAKETLRLEPSRLIPPVRARVPLPWLASPAAPLPDSAFRNGRGELTIKGQACRWRVNANGRLPSQARERTDRDAVGMRQSGSVHHRSLKAALARGRGSWACHSMTLPPQESRPGMSVRRSARALNVRQIWSIRFFLDCEGPMRVARRLRRTRGT